MKRTERTGERKKTSRHDRERERSRANRRRVRYNNTNLPGDNPMSEPASFVALMGRVKAGESSAAEELLRQYEPTVRRAIRVRMVNPALRRTMDSMDLCQSVMGSFFVRAALGQYDLGTPEQLVGLLVRLARNKVADHARHEQAKMRDHRRTKGDGSVVDQIAARQESPSQIGLRQRTARMLPRQAQRRGTLFGGAARFGPRVERPGPRTEPRSGGAAQTIAAGRGPGGKGPGDGLVTGRMR